MVEGLFEFGGGPGFGEVAGVEEDGGVVWVGGEGEGVGVGVGEDEDFGGEGSV